MPVKLAHDDDDGDDGGNEPYNRSGGALNFSVHLWQ